VPWCPGHATRRWVGVALPLAWRTTATCRARRYHGLGFRMFAYCLDSQLFQRALAAGIGAVRALA